MENETSNNNETANSIKHNVKRSFWGAMWFYHKFFNRESPSYMQGTNRLKYYLRYPSAYIKFMILMAKDYRDWVRGQNCA